MHPAIETISPFVFRFFLSRFVFTVPMTLFVKNVFFI